MDTEEKQNREVFQDALGRLITQYSLEFDMSVADIAVALMQEQFRLMAELHKLVQHKE